MCDVFKDEFRLANFGLSHKQRSDFIVSHWRWHPSVYIAYRVIAALYITGFFVAAITTFTVNTLAYLTIWTYFMLTLYFVLSAIIVVYHSFRTRAHAQQNWKSVLVHQSNNYKTGETGVTNIAFIESNSSNPNNIPVAKESNDQTASRENSLENLAEEISIPMKICWILGNVVQAFAIIVTIVYFTALFPLVGHTNFVDVNFHGANTFFVLLDTCLTARPVRLLHVIHPIIYGGCYLVFSAIYWSFDHVNHVLYPGVLDWNYPGTTLIWVCGLTLVGVPLLQLAFFGAHRLKLHVSNK